MLHGGGGLETDQTAAFNKWAAWLAERGVASVILDSFRGRGMQNYHYTGDRNAYRAVLRERANDAQRMLALLRQSDWADGARLFLFGQSQGAIAAGFMNFETPERAPTIAFYNGCDPKYFDAVPASKNNPPTLWLLGDADSVARPSNCIAMHEDMGRRGGNADSIKVVVFPGAHHTFDWQAPSRQWGPHTLQYNKAADEGSKREIEAFLRQQGWIR
jgi:dienelactone hydrolase